MGNFFKKKQPLKKSPLYMPLNHDPYASFNYNYDINDIIERVNKLENKIDFCETNILTLEENTQENLKLLSIDIHHISNNLNIKPPIIT